MRTDYLYEFIKLTETGNFQTAADALFISQSTLSKHILAMENELGFDLISHNKTKYSLTAEGLEFLPYAMRICDIRMEYTESFKNRGKSKMLDVGTCHFTAIEDDMFSNAILKYSREYPESLIHNPPVLATDSIDSLLVESDHGKFSCVIAKSLSTDAVKTTSSLITCEILRTWTISVLTRRDHPKAGKIFTLKDVADEPLISLAYPTFANSLAVKAFKLEGLIPFFSNTLNSFRSICDMVSTGKGVFLATEAVNLSQLPEELCLTEISPHITADTFVAYNGNFNHEHEVRFLEILKEEFR